jgi:hypothetical protein
MSNRISFKFFQILFCIILFVLTFMNLLSLSTNHYFLNGLISITLSLLFLVIAIQRTQ